MTVMIPLSSFTPYTNLCSFVILLLQYPERFALKISGFPIPSYGFSNIASSKEDIRF